MNQQLIARLRSGEIAAENNGTLEQLREVLKAAFPDCRFSPSGAAKFYKKNNEDSWTGFGINLGDKAVPITDFFKEDRAVELLRELVKRYNSERFIPYCDKINEAEQFLNELNKDK